MSDQVDIGVFVDWDRTNFDRFLEMLEGGEAAHVVAGNLAEEARRHWQFLAESQLDSTAQMYVDGLSDPMPDDRAGGGAAGYVIELGGTLANWLEQGLDSFDMRSENTNLLKGGAKYKVIPFTHLLPSTSGSIPPQRNVSAKALGHSYQPLGPATTRLRTRFESHRLVRFSGETGPQSRRLTPPSASQLKSVGVNSPASLARTIEKTLRATNEPLRFGGRLAETLTLAHHTKPIYSGMRLETQSFSLGEGMSGDLDVGRTFRTISAGGDGWIHPGYMARHFAEQTAAHLRARAGTIAQAAVDDIVRSLG